MFAGEVITVATVRIIDLRYDDGLPIRHQLEFVRQKDGTYWRWVVHTENFNDFLQLVDI